MKLKSDALQLNIVLIIGSLPLDIKVAILVQMSSKDWMLLNGPKNIGLHSSDFVMKFNITDKCLDIQSLATSIFILEGYNYPETVAYCCCSQWV